MIRATLAPRHHQAAAQRTAASFRLAAWPAARRLGRFPFKRTTAPLSHIQAYRPGPLLHFGRQRSRERKQSEQCLHFMSGLSKPHDARARRCGNKGAKGRAPFIRQTRSLGACFSWYEYNHRIAVTRRALCQVQTLAPLTQLRAVLACNYSYMNFAGDCTSRSTISSGAPSAPACPSLPYSSAPDKSQTARCVAATRPGTMKVPAPAWLASAFKNWRRCQ